MEKYALQESDLHEESSSQAAPDVVVVVGAGEVRAEEGQ